MPHRLSDIAAALGARVEGDGTLIIAGAREPAAAGADDLALALEPKYADGLARGAARAALMWEGADWRAHGLAAALFVARPRYAMAGVTRMLDPGPDIAPGIHPSAVIASDAEIGGDAAIGPLVVIGSGVRIGAGARIGAHASIAAGSEIGDGLLLHAGARIGPRVRIGARFIGHSGSVVGADGFSFVTPDKSGVEEVRETLGRRAATQDSGWTRIHSLGAVAIGDDVELGANSCIDRGTVRDTVVGSGTKIDNLIQIGHNVVIGQDCMLCGQSGVAGSARVGDRVVVGGKSAINDNIFVGDDVIIGGGTNVYTNAPAGRVLLGSPAVEMSRQLEINRAIRRLPRLLKQVAELHKAVSKRADND